MPRLNRGRTSCRRHQAKRCRQPQILAYSSSIKTVGRMAFLGTITFILWLVTEDVIYLWSIHLIFLLLQWSQALSRLVRYRRTLVPVSEFFIITPSHRCAQSQSLICSSTQDWNSVRWVMSRSVKILYGFCRPHWLVRTAAADFVSEKCSVKQEWSPEAIFRSAPHTDVGAAPILRTVTLTDLNNLLVWNLSRFKVGRGWGG